MSQRRLIILLLGPIPILLGSIALSRWARPTAEPAPKPNHVVPHVGPATAPENRAPLALDGPASGVGQQSAAASEPSAAARAARSAAPPWASSALTAACRKTAGALAPRLGSDCGWLVEAPFVVAGDLPAEELARWQRQTIGPAARAMGRSYFDARPDQPITVLLFSSEESYNRYAKELFGDEGVSVYGYYKPNLRTLVMNIATGGGTLVHELTHALVDFDFPQIPDWFNEGLASLHEQCRIRPDESGITGLTNWRLRGLQETIRRGRAPSLKAMLANDDFRGDQVGLNYAQARYFCQYMQSTDNPCGRDVLPQFYRQFKSGHGTDSQGLAAVERLFPDLSWSELDRAFQTWVLLQEFR